MSPRAWMPLVAWIALGAVTCAAPRALGPAPTSRSACEAAGGSWAKHGELHEFACDRPTSDAGKRCTGAADCLSFCIVKGDPRDCDRRTAPNEGVCYERELNTGCHCLFEHTRAWMQCGE